MKQILFIMIGVIMSTGCSKQMNKVEILSYGITDNIPDETVARPDAVHGEDDIYDGWNLLESTSEIPLEENIQFGIEYVFRGEADNGIATVEEVIIFPEGGLTDPESGRTYSTDIADMEIQVNEPNNFCYRLETDWETIPGIWVFQVRREGVVLAEQKFKIVDK
ncbi:DUF3859 domain-containing protein [Tichowtungia aerotolerans]|uniref:DUF3859 domain-containing protein n=1 Tax=Tichowtungia aerotolerans TaxID=2697043 RepID=A0A6P1M4H6_9BACT|nr:DUF3859 domain-containing protein [Tichowtungia aerotolerans]QHI68741.1 DUF3859 domain-containing protein [Tichowtungia aerotolerans]